MPEITITEVSIPVSLDAPDAAEFLACVEVRNAVNRHDSGTDDLTYTAEELLPGWLKTAFEPKRMFAARLDGRLVARGIYSRSLGQIAIGLVVLAIWGTTLLQGLVPEDGISWQGHLFGALGGILAARVLHRRAVRAGTESPAALTPS